MNLDLEFEKELEMLREGGIKFHPLRLEYEQKVRELSCLKEQLFKESDDKEYIARKLHNQRRSLGEQYKYAAPPLLREYIFYATEKKYGDPLGPDFETLKQKKTLEEIIDSSTRPIQDLNHRLTMEGFIWWYQHIFKK